MFAQPAATPKLNLELIPGRFQKTPTKIIQEKKITKVYTIFTQSAIHLDFNWSNYWNTS